MRWVRLYLVWALLSGLIFFLCFIRFLLSSHPHFRLKSGNYKQTNTQTRRFPFKSAGQRPPQKYKLRRHSSQTRTGIISQNLISSHHFGPLRAFERNPLRFWVDREPLPFFLPYILGGCFLIKYNHIILVVSASHSYSVSHIFRTPIGQRKLLRYFISCSNCPSHSDEVCSTTSRIPFFTQPFITKKQRQCKTTVLHHNSLS